MLKVVLILAKVVATNNSSNIGGGSEQHGVSRLLPFLLKTVRGR